MALHDLADDILPLSRLFLHTIFKPKALQFCRRDSIDPIEEAENEEEGPPLAFSVLPRLKGRASVVARLSMRFQRFAGLSDSRLSRDDELKRAYVARRHKST